MPQLLLCREILAVKCRLTTAEALAEIPTYYIMDRDRTMPETVAPEMPTAAEVAANASLPDEALAVHVAEYRRNGSRAACSGTV